ncbi:MAG: DNA-directed RNA polymerase subunit P [Candidatus Bathyarchaeia archaeon]
MSNSGEVVYECVRCGKRVTLQKLIEMYEEREVKCPECNYRILKKTRPPIVKKVKAI